MSECQWSWSMVSSMIEVYVCLLPSGSKQHEVLLTGNYAKEILLVPMTGTGSGKKDCSLSAGPLWHSTQHRLTTSQQNDASINCKTTLTIRTALMHAINKEMELSPAVYLRNPVPLICMN